MDDFGLGGLSTTLGLSSGGCFLITSLAIPAGGLLDLLQLILQLCNLGVLFLGDRMGGSMGGLVVLHGLGQLVLQFCDVPLSVAGAVSHGAGPVVVDVLSGQVEAALEGGGQVGVRAQLLDHLPDLLQGVALLLFGGRGIGAGQLYADDGGRAVTVALAEVFAGLALVDGGEVVGALGPVFAGKNNLVGVHRVPSCRCGVSCVHVSCTFTI